MQAHPAPVPTNQVAPQNEAWHLMNAHSEPVPNNHVAPQNEPEPVDKVTQNFDAALVMKASTVIGNNEHIQMNQSFESTPMKEGTTVLNNAHPPSVTNDTAPLDEQKIEKWVETKYAAPAEYDNNKNGVLDKQEFEDALADGNLRIQKITVVESPNVGGNVAENFSPQSSLPERRRKQKKTGGRRRIKRKKGRR